MLVIRAKLCKFSSRFSSRFSPHIAPRIAPPHLLRLDTHAPDGSEEGYEECTSLSRSRLRARHYVLPLQAQGHGVLLNRGRGRVVHPRGEGQVGKEVVGKDAGEGAERGKGGDGVGVIWA